MLTCDSTYAMCQQRSGTFQPTHYHVPTDNTLRGMIRLLYRTYLMKYCSRSKFDRDAFNNESEKTANQ